MRWLRRSYSVLAVLAVLGGGCLPVVVPDVPHALAQETGSARFAAEHDLAAMVLTPADLEALGLTGFGKFGNGFINSFYGFVAERAEASGLSEGEVRRTFSGWQGEYGVTLGLPRFAVHGNGEVDRIVGTFVQEYTTVSEAEAAFAFEADFQGGPAATGDVEEAPLVTPIGDAAALVRVSGDHAGYGGSYRQLELDVRLGRLTAAIVLVNRSEKDPDTAEIEVLGRRLLERMGTVLREDEVNPMAMVLRLDPAAAPLAFESEGYRLIDGEMPPYYLGFEDDILASPAAFARAERIYELEQQVRPGDPLGADAPYVLMRLFTFANDASASAFLRERPAVVATEVELVVTSEAVDGAATGLGDESLALATDLRYRDGRRFELYEVYTRVGSMVAMTAVMSSVRPDLAPVVELAEAQVVCLQSNEVCTPVAVPAALLADPPRSDAGTPAAAEQAIA